MLPDAKLNTFFNKDLLIESFLENIEIIGFLKKLKKFKVPIKKYFKVGQKKSLGKDEYKYLKESTELGLIHCVEGTELHEFFDKGQYEGFKR